MFGKDSNNKEMQIDSIYYGSNGKGVSNKLFADYMRVKIDSDMQFCDFYMTGEVKAKGGYAYIDKDNDDESKFNGECISFFKNGNMSKKANFINGLLTGEYIEYKEDGLVAVHAEYIDGKLNGTYTEFIDDDICKQIEYVNDLPSNRYKILNNRGAEMIFDMKTDTQVWYSPGLEDLHNEYVDGVSWKIFNKNGIIIHLSNSVVKDYGKYYRIEMVIENNTMEAIDFDPVKAINTYSIDKKGESNGLVVLSSEEYLKKVKRAQNWNAAFVGLSEGLAASDAGYSTSKTTTNINTYSKTNRTHISATSTTKEYDAAAAYQASVIADERLARYKSNQLAEREKRKDDYIKITTIKPNEYLVGYIHIYRGSRDKELYLNVNINGAIYKFQWDINI
ncbi:MAG: hypothetical protein R3Y22_09220 [Bacteroidales bacterium]